MPELIILPLPVSVEEYQRQQWDRYWVVQREANRINPRYVKMRAKDAAFLASLDGLTGEEANALTGDGPVR